MENVRKNKKNREVGVTVNKKNILKKSLVIILFYVLITILNNFKNIMAFIYMNNAIIKNYIKEFAL